MTFRSHGNGGPVRLSQITGSPTFRASAVNAVAVVPLLSSDRNGLDDSTTHSSKSFDEFLSSLHRHNDINRNRNYGSDKNYEISSDLSSSTSNSNNNESLVVVIPNSNLTRPGDWKYNETPLRNFHWGHGCQRLCFFDGRPYHSRLAHDRLINHELTRNWIDLCTSRRTGALIGVLNVRDCPDQETLDRAIQEWNQWAERYSTPPYEVTAHGRDAERDTVVPRLYVFDSFHESFVTNPNVDLQKATEKLNSTCLVAFPPVDKERSEMMELHVNVVVNDLAVAIFQELEGKIRESDALMAVSGSVKAGGGGMATDNGPSQQNAAAGAGFFGRSSSSSNGTTNSTADEESPRGGSGELSIENLAAVVGPNSKLATARHSGGPNNNKDHALSASIVAKLENAATNNNRESLAKTASRRTLSAVKTQLLTPLDEFWDYSELSPKDSHEMMKREVARREKFAADLSLLAGSPLDAYERYTKAADLCKTTSPDPLWYASALEGCAAAHIAMADVGGFNVDEYLESSFQLPEEIMACALVTTSGKEKSNAKSGNSHNNKDNNKENMPQIILAMCEDALDVTSRHPKLACFHSELLLKLAWYTAEIEDVHVRCQWGLGEGECYGGDPDSDKRRWEMASATRLNFLELKNKDGEDVIYMNTYKRCQKCTEFMHMAAATAALDPVTRADIALRCVSICWRGLWPTTKPTNRGRSGSRIQFKRKASFFAITAAEAMSDVHGGNKRAGALWIQASRMLSQTANNLGSGNYGWATLRAVALHALVLQGSQESSEEAAMQLLMLVSTISPSTPKSGEMSPTRRSRGGPNNVPTGSGRSDSYLESIADARSYLRESAKVVAKDARARSKDLFSQPNEISSLLVVQSKWVEDVPLKPSLIPMGDFSSDFSHRVLALRSAWSAIRFENCSMAQEQLLRQIYELRKDSPASSCTLQTINSSKNSQTLPIEIASIGFVTSESSARLERVELKKKVQHKDHSMSTFFNPYATKKDVKKTITIPRGEEQYISISFANKLSVPFDIASCKLRFDTRHSDRIKAPSISFVIPAQSKIFTVQFPFIVLDKLNDDDAKEADIDALVVKGMYITALSRSIFLPIGKWKEDDKCVKTKDQIIAKSASLYPRRDYSKSSKYIDKKSNIDSPRLEIIPPQPNLRASFVSSPTPIDDETLIPVLLADGEIFTLPNICVSNDTGLRGLGKIEKLQISAIGLPGIPKVELYNSLSETEDEEKVPDKNVKANTSCPISISANCVGMDLDTLNSSNSNNSVISFIAAKLSAAPGMGTLSKECNVTLRFRYRGRSVSPTLEVWRKCEVEIRILRVKGPRIPSLSFRCDLYWDSGYTELCNALAVQESRRKYVSARTYDIDLPRSGSTDDEEFVANRLGQDPGIHVCSDEVAVMISVANESASPIILSREDSSPIGFAESKMSTLKISPGVSAKFPIILPRIERSTDICERLIAMTRFKWKGDIPGASMDDAQETGGPIFPVNRRVREGILEVPSICLKNIVDENPIFLSRICKAPCSIAVNITGQADGSQSKSVEVGKPVDISVTVDMAKWLSNDLLQRTNCTLTFCCARKGRRSPLKLKENANSVEGNEYIWIGQIRKVLACGEKSSQNPHLARLIFLNEGDYYVSACLSLSRVDNDDDAKEVFWAEKAGMVHASRRI